MKNVYLAGAVRTPIGKFGGTLASWTAADLGVAVAAESLRRAGVAPDQITESIWGCARQAGGGPNVARQIIYRAGVPDSVSRVPYFAEGARWGMRMGNTQLVDGMYRDGFSDPLSGLLMGQTAEKLARQYEISRDEQDEFALRSQQRAEAAIEAGRFKDEVMTLEISGKKGESTSFARDEHCRAGTTLQDLAKLSPVFYKDGTVTAGNSAGIADGAAAVVVLSEEGLKRFGATPQVRIVDYEISGVAPEIMGIGPVPAVRALRSAEHTSE